MGMFDNPPSSFKTASESMCGSSSITQSEVRSES